MKCARLVFALALTASTSTAWAAGHQPLSGNPIRNFFYQHDRQRYYGATQYANRDFYDHYPTYNYGFGMPTYQWDWFGPHHRPRRVVGPGYYGMQHAR